LEATKAETPKPDDTPKSAMEEKETPEGGNERELQLQLQNKQLELEAAQARAEAAQARAEAEAAKKSKACSVL